MAGEAYYEHLWIGSATVPSGAGPLMLLLRADEFGGYESGAIDSQGRDVALVWVRTDSPEPSEVKISRRGDEGSERSNLWSLSILQVDPRTDDYARFWVGVKNNDSVARAIESPKIAYARGQSHELRDEVDIFSSRLGKIHLILPGQTLFTPIRIPANGAPGLAPSFSAAFVERELATWATRPSVTVRWSKEPGR
jgi:hypothetical protein